jgi:pyruvate formate lyase activating enzyme
VLSFGTAGCNLGCSFCQNWDISKSREMDTLASIATPAMIAQTAKRFECQSVAFTYNDPTVFMEYAIDVADACRREGVSTVAVTAGYMCPEPRAEFYRYIDAANVDLKGFTESFYSKICAGHLDGVLDTLLYIHTQTNVWLEITTLLIPGENDSPDEIDAMSKWIVENLGPDVPLHFSAFHPDFKMLETMPTPLSTLRRARATAMNNGLRYVYTGNVNDLEGGITLCANCGRGIIARDRYAITGWYLNAAGNCQFCGTAVPGVFHPKPGTWGNRRLPVSIGV